MTQQQQERPQTALRPVRLNGIEKLFATLSLVFGSAGFVYFWLLYWGRWSDQRTDYFIAKLALLLSLLVSSLAGLFLLLYLRKLARRLLMAAGLLATAMLMYGIYDAWRYDYFLNFKKCLPLLGFAAALFWLIWLARYVKQREGLKEGEA
jgi:hypothetical protein